MRIQSEIIENEREKFGIKQRKISYGMETNDSNVANFSLEAMEARGQ